ncbi:MAG: mycothiol synthase [Acidimicrobiia bacterium]|nr:mycothiol synthase [Acidimicrobiia bacterium]MDH4308907.1 mycothiol synthase [Acidimicrobiia bacterium]MDH5295000.1 mycothiol synthase [Acidimicrobiia bacterium]
MRLRPVRLPDDLSGLERLFGVITECDGHSPIGEHKYLDLRHADADRVTGLVGEVDGEPVAYVAMAPTQEQGTWAIELALHPFHRERDTDQMVIDAAVEHVAGSGARRVRSWVFHPTLASVFEESGFVPERELRQLRISLPPPRPAVFPPDMDVRGFVVGADEATWLAVNNQAFSGHPENGSWTRDVLEDRKGQDWFDPNGFRMLWHGERLAGFCWTKVQSEDVGEIYVIATAVGYRGRGLGAALVLEGLRYMSEQEGLGRAMLYVDADNKEANRLYESLGFRLDHVDRAMVREL